MKLWVSALSGLCFWCNIANAVEEYTVSDMRDFCMLTEKEQFPNNPSEALAAGYCFGFMHGAGSVLQLNCGDDKYAGGYKIAQNTTNAQRIRAFLNWSDAHPELWNEKAFIAIVGLIKGLPCNQ